MVSASPTISIIPAGLRPQARFGAQPPKAALSAEIIPQFCILNSAFCILCHGLLQVGDQIVDIFQSHGHTQERIGDAQLFPVFL